MSIEEKPCTSCRYFGKKDRMCHHAYFIGNIMKVLCHPPERDSKDGCGAAGNWFEPLDDGAEDRE